MSPEQSSSRRANSSFAGLSAEELDTHMRISTYSGFRLTDAVRPAYDLAVIPEIGYKIETYVDPESGRQVPVIMCSASSEAIVGLLYELIWTCSQNPSSNKQSHHLEAVLVLELGEEECDKY